MPAASMSSTSGRAASMARRQALSAGRSALPAATERVRTSDRSAMLANTVPVAAKPPAPVALPAPSPPPTAGRSADGAATGRTLAMARRAQMSRWGRGDAAPAPASRAPRHRSLEDAPQVVASTMTVRQSVTGLRIGRGSSVTGDAAGATQPVSGTQNIGIDGGAPLRAAGTKVGVTQTPKGNTVSGTSIRSRVRVTGDEAGDSAAITGDADQRLADDMTERADAGAYAAAQFQRQSNPHGASVFGTNLGRSATNFGSRDRGRREESIETTEGGLSITGSAVGRTNRVTGVEGGACRQLTGDQYLTPGRHRAECGGANGRTGAQAKAADSQVRQRVSGYDVEQHRLVTGTARATSSVLTGTPYQGPGTVQAGTNKTIPPGASAAGVTGNVPLRSNNVTGTGRGADRALSGTPYFREASQPDVVENAVAALDARFSIQSPQRTSQLKATHAARSQCCAAERITGSFAIGMERVTGNLEFLYRPRRSNESNAPTAHSKLTGEGRTTGTAITGASWSDQSNVTGTDAGTATQRNPTQRGGKAQPFAGAQRFKEHANREEYKQLVTGMAGWSSNTAAKVTLSGGAQG